MKHEYIQWLDRAKKLLQANKTADALENFQSLLMVLENERGISSATKTEIKGFIRLLSPEQETKLEPIQEEQPAPKAKKLRKKTKEESSSENALYSQDNSSSNDSLFFKGYSSNSDSLGPASTNTAAESNYFKEITERADEEYKLACQSIAAINGEGKEIRAQYQIALNHIEVALKLLQTKNKATVEDREIAQYCKALKSIINHNLTAFDSEKIENLKPGNKRKLIS